MDLIKFENQIDNRLSFYHKKDDEVNNRDLCLLGFKDNFPVLSANKMCETKSNMRLVVVEVDPKSGEKFINLNGKKLKIVPENSLTTEIRKNAQIIKSNVSVTSLVNGTTGPVGMQVVTTMPPLKALDKKIPPLKPFNKGANDVLNKINVMNVNNGDNSKQINKKTIVIKHDKYVSLKNCVSVSKDAQSNERTEILKNNHACNYKVVDNFVNKEDQDTNISMKRKMEALNLTTVNKHMTSFDSRKRVDAVINTEKKFVNQAIQTDNSLQQKQIFTLPPQRQLVDQGIQTEESLLSIDELLSTDYTDLMEFIERNNHTPLTEAHKKFFEDLRKAVMPNPDGNLPIHVGVLDNNVGLVKRMCIILKARTDGVNLENHDNCTPLQLAILNNSSLEIVKVLLENDSDLSVVDGEGNNTLHLAVLYERTAILELLLIQAEKIGFNLDKFNYEGLSPLMVACCYRLHECAKLLIDYKACVNAKDQKSGRTALFHAAESHDIKMVQILLENDADTKIRNFFGTSPRDAMYEVEEIPKEIKNLILAKTKRKNPPDSVEPKIVVKKSLKTYAKLRKINDFPIATIATCK